MPNEVGGFMSAAISAAGGIDSLNVKACVVGLTCDAPETIQYNSPFKCDYGTVTNCYSLPISWKIWYPSTCGGIEGGTFSPLYGGCGYYKTINSVEVNCDCV